MSVTKVGANLMARINYEFSENADTFSPLDYDGPIDEEDDFGVDGSDDFDVDALWNQMNDNHNGSITALAVISTNNYVTDDEGSDQAFEGVDSQSITQPQHLSKQSLNSDDIKRHHNMQHSQKHVTTPHGTMNSILSAASFVSNSPKMTKLDKSKLKYHQKSTITQENSMVKQERRESESNKNEIATKKVLRMRATKYFRGSAHPIPASGISNDNNLYDAVKQMKYEISSNDSYEKMNTGCPDDYDYIGEVSDNNDNQDSNENETRNEISTALPLQLPMQQLPPCQNSSSNTMNKRELQSMKFFPRTKVLSPLIKSPIIPVRSAPQDNNDIRDIILSNSSEPLSQNSIYSDPPLYHHSDSDIQSQATTDLTGYGSNSDLENAARKILIGRKRGSIPSIAATYKNNLNDLTKAVKNSSVAFQVAFAAVNVEDVTKKSSSEAQVAKNPEATSSDTRKPRPSRERLMKKTGKNVRISLAGGQYSQQEGGISDDRNVETIGASVKSLSVTQRAMSPDMISHFGNRVDMDYQKQRSSNLETKSITEQKMSTESELTRHQLYSNAIDARFPEDWIEQTYSFSNFSTSNEESRVTEENKHSNCVSYAATTSDECKSQHSIGEEWGDPYYAFLPLGQSSSHVNEKQENGDHSFDKVLSDGTTFIPSNSQLHLYNIECKNNSLWNDQQHPRKYSTSSLEEDMQDVESVDSKSDEEFDCNDYFHNFSLTEKNAREETLWEDMPSSPKVEFSPRRGEILDANIKNAEHNTSNAMRNDAHTGSNQSSSNYITRFAEIDFFALNDDEHVHENKVTLCEYEGVGDKNRSDSSKYQSELGFEQPNTLKETVPVFFGERREELYYMEEPKQKSHKKKLQSSSRVYPSSDGDHCRTRCDTNEKLQRTPSHKAKRNSELFGSSNPVDMRNCYSDGERLDSDRENSPGRFSFVGTPMRWRARKKNKYNTKKTSVNGLNFFGMKRNESMKKKGKKIESTSYELIRKESEFSSESSHLQNTEYVSPLHNHEALQYRSQLDSFVSERICTIGKESLVKNVLLHDSLISTKSKLLVDNTHLFITNESQQANNISPKSELNAIMGRSSNALVEPTASVLYNSGLNTSILSQTTKHTSNKVISVSSLNEKSHRKTSRSITGQSQSPSLPPRQRLEGVKLHSSGRSSQSKHFGNQDRNRIPESPGYTGIVISNSDADDDGCSVSSLHSDSLGSLLTKNKVVSMGRVIETDQSTDTGMSEIERLRRENERLREQLENASHFSSKVSSLYAENLRKQNKHLQQRIKLVSNTHEDIELTESMIHRSTVVEMLERNFSTEHRRIHRRKDRDGSGLIPTTQKEVTEFITPRPTLPLINGADFDDDSITTYSELGKGKQMHFIRDVNWDIRDAPFILQKITATTQNVAEQIKTVANEIHSQRKEDRTCKVSFSKPLELIRTCTRKDAAHDTDGLSETAVTCASTVTRETKAVIARVMGCMKPYQSADKSLDPAVFQKNSFQSANTDSKSDSFVGHHPPKNDLEISFSGAETGEEV